MQQAFHHAYIQGGLDFIKINLVKNIFSTKTNQYVGKKHQDPSYLGRNTLVWLLAKTKTMLAYILQNLVLSNQKIFNTHSLPFSFFSE